MSAPLFKTCRQCGARSVAEWCGQLCFDAYREGRGWHWLKKQIEKRDKGICNLCGLDTKALRKKIEKLIADVTPTRTGTGYKKGHQYFEAAQKLQALQREHPWAIKKWMRSPWAWRTFTHLWEADHRYAKSRGGKDELGNLQTLCLKCHRSKTKYDMKMKREEA